MMIFEVRESGWRLWAGGSGAKSAGDDPEVREQIEAQVKLISLACN